MKVGIPAFLSSTLILFLIGSSIYFWVNYFEVSHISEFPNKTTFFLWLIYLIGPITILLLIKRFKLIFLENDFLMIVYPFLFKKNRFNFSDVKKIDWSIYGGGRSADFLRMNIVFKSKESIFLSDQELENFSKIESEILKKLKLRPSLKNRMRLKKEQAKGNLIYCGLGLLISGVFLIGFVDGIKNGFQEEWSLLFVIPLLVFIRILFHTFTYIKVLRNDA